MTNREHGHSEAACEPDAVRAADHVGPDAFVPVPFTCAHALDPDELFRKLADPLALARLLVTVRSSAPAEGGWTRVDPSRGRPLFVLVDADPATRAIGASLVREQPNLARPFLMVAQAIDPSVVAEVTDDMRAAIDLPVIGTPLNLALRVEDAVDSAGRPEGSSRVTGTIWAPSPSAMGLMDNWFDRWTNMPLEWWERRCLRRRAIAMVRHVPSRPA